MQLLWSYAMNFNFTRQKLAKIIPDNQYIDDWFNALSIILPDYEIDSVNRVACFIGQCAHESGNFKRLKENLNYSAMGLRKTFGKYFPNNELANQYARQPQKIANRVYANRYGNGSESSGDGWAYCGRGLIQLTFYDNYKSFADSINADVRDIPEYLMTFEGAVQAAAWYFETRDINIDCDRLDHNTITRKINGGTHGLADRISKSNFALKILKG